MHEGLRDSDVHHLAMALKQNLTLTELCLCDSGSPLTPRGLQPLIDTVQHRNNTLECVVLHDRFRSEQATIDSSCKFHLCFCEVCRSIRIGTTEKTELVLLQWISLFQSVLPRTRMTILFCLARARPKLSCSGCKRTVLRRTRRFRWLVRRTSPLHIGLGALPATILWDQERNESAIFNIIPIDSCEMKRL